MGFCGFCVLYVISLFSPNLQQIKNANQNLFISSYINVKGRSINAFPLILKIEKKMKNPELVSVIVMITTTTEFIIIRHRRRNKDKHSTRYSQCVSSE